MRPTSKADAMQVKPAAGSTDRASIPWVASYAGVGAHATRGSAPDTTERTLISGALLADQVSWVTVSTGEAGQRLDNFLLRLARGVPKSHVYRIVRSGEVRINKGRARVDQRVEAGDVVRIPPIRVAADRQISPMALPSVMPAIVFEDEHLIALDKPSGLASHGGSGISHGLIELMRASRPNQPFLELAHRLDRETSGVLLLGKTRRALLGLHERMREGEIDKRYLALVIGDWLNDRQHLTAPLHKYLTAEGERRVAVGEDGLASHTVVTLKRRFGRFSLVEAQLKTGRTHQIRVHLAHAGFPIVGDDKYGDFTLNRTLSRHAGLGDGIRLGRMFLHAHAMDFVHPVTGEPIALRTALPAPCDELLQALERARAI